MVLLAFDYNTEERVVQGKNLQNALHVENLKAQTIRPHPAT
jgi:hypothetical protein